MTGLRYLRLFEQESVKTYAQAAEILGVSRQRVYQFVSLVTKLPAEVTGFLAGNADPDVLRHFTERQLRPLTVLTTDSEKLARFAAELTDIGKRASWAYPVEAELG